MSINTLNAQSEEEYQLPYSAIEGYPETYTSGNVVKRMIDGLGYRYHWATDSLRQEDLEYKIGETNRTALETLEHIYNLSNTILNCSESKPNVRSGDKEEMEWNEMRSATLNNLQKAAFFFSLKNDDKLKDAKLIFQRGERTSDYEFWHLLNGPLADALTHVGQIVSSRRASGNPLDPRVSVFMGKNRE